MSLSKISIRFGAPLFIAIWMISGCASQQQKVPDPASPPPQPSKSEQPTTPKPPPQSETNPEAGQAESATGQAADKSAEAQLQAAREKLQVSEETEKQAQKEFENLKQSGQASAEVTKDYETYLNRIKGLSAENREIVEKLEAAMAAQPQAKTDQSAGKEGAIETARLDRQLNQSLSEFDEMLLKEMDRIQAQSERKMTSLAEEAAAAAERLRQKGIDVGGAEGEEQASRQESDENDNGDPGERSETADKGSTGQSGGQGQGGQEGRTAEAETGMTGSEQAKTDTGGDAGGTKSSDRRRGYSEADDDIVARQLREAAEKETDPELKEKLWKEYEDYKRNTSQ